jgi:pilus assembly protein CpaB
MNSRQRRGVVLLVVSAFCAVAAFAGVLAVVGDARSEVGPRITAYRLSKDVDAYSPVTPAQLQKVGIPKRYLPATAVRDLSELQGKIAAAPLRRGSLLQTDMIAGRPALRSGQMEIAIMIDAETGVAGKINPGSRVNIFATFAGKKETDPDTSQIIVAGARVIDVGTIRAFDDSQDSQDSRRLAGQGVPITFALDAEDAQRVAYAESFAKHVRLARVAPGDVGDVPPADRSYTLAGDTGGKP